MSVWISALVHTADAGLFICKGIMVVALEYDPTWRISAFCELFGVLGNGGQHSSSLHGGLSFRAVDARLSSESRATEGWRRSPSNLTILSTAFLSLSGPAAPVFQMLPVGPFRCMISCRRCFSTSICCFNKRRRSSITFTSSSEDRAFLPFSRCNAVLSMELERVSTVAKKELQLSHLGPGRAALPARASAAVTMQKFIL